MKTISTTGARRMSKKNMDILEAVVVIGVPVSVVASLWVFIGMVGK